ncbi:MAG: DUF6602 domain-containing protein [Pseudomonadota bacterium]
MNKAKTEARIDGKSFLRSAFAAEQEVIAVQLKLSSKSITHDGLMGEVNEQHFIQFLRKYLPMRYAIDRGIVIDCNGATSDQIDIVMLLSGENYWPKKTNMICLINFLVSYGRPEISHGLHNTRS